MLLVPVRVRAFELSAKQPRLSYRDHRVAVEAAVEEVLADVVEEVLADAVEEVLADAVEEVVADVVEEVLVEVVEDVRVVEIVTLVEVLGLSFELVTLAVVDELALVVEVVPIDLLDVRLRAGAEALLIESDDDADEVVRKVLEAEAVLDVEENVATLDDSTLDDLDEEIAVLESGVVDEMPGVLAVELDALAVVLAVAVVFFVEAVDDVVEQLLRVDCEEVAFQVELSWAEDFVDAVETVGIDVAVFALSVNAVETEELTSELEGTLDATALLELLTVDKVVVEACLGEEVELLDAF